MTRQSKEQGKRSLWTHSLSVKVIGEEVVSWKRRVESFITSQSPFVKINLSIVAILACTYGGFSLAQSTMDSESHSSFEVYRSIRSAEAAVKANPAVPPENSQVMIAVAFDTADDYIREIFGSPVPEKIPAAEAVVRQPLAPPLPDVDNGQPPLPENLEIAAAQRSGVSSRMLLWPMRGGYVSSRFGMRWGRMHQGTDIAAPHGTPILAAADGKVVFSGWEGGYGQLIIVDHGNGVKTKYGHCSKRLVSVGQRVRQGDVIGHVGSTGNSTGPHLHYEVIRAGQAKNPEFFTRRR